MQTIPLFVGKKQEKIKKNQKTACNRRCKRYHLPCQSRGWQYAGVAQLVERHLAKVNVEGPNPFARSIFFPFTPFIQKRLYKQSAESQYVAESSPDQAI